MPENNSYVSYLLNSKSAPLVLPYFWGNKKATKEISESVAMLEAAKSLPIKLNESLVIVVGDGVLPRTGALFALFTKATVRSYDPLMRLDEVKNLPQLDRLDVYARPIDKNSAPIGCAGKDTVVIFPHSHAHMDVVLKRLKNYKTLSMINMPCCVQIPEKYFRKTGDTFDKLPVVYEDYHVLSAKRTVYVWSCYEKI